MKICFIGCYSDWFLEGDLRKYDIYGVVLGSLPDAVKRHFTRYVEIRDFTEYAEQVTSSQFHIAESRSYQLEYLKQQMPGCDYYHTFRCVIRGDGETEPDVWEVTSDLYCDRAPQYLCTREAKSPWNSEFLRHVFRGRVLNYNEFKDDSDKDVRIVIPSVIHTTDALIYNAPVRRSIFSQEERYKQLLQQLQGIYRKTPQAEVYVLEGSQPYLAQLRELSKYATIILFYDTRAEYYGLRHPVKSYYEFCSIWLMLQSLTNYKWLIKFGARYSLLDTTVFNRLCSDRPVLHIIQPHRTYTNETIINSVLFSYPHSYCDKLREKLDTLLDDHKDKLGSETVFYDEDAEHIEYLSIYGMDGVHSQIGMA